MESALDYCGRRCFQSLLLALYLCLVALSAPAQETSQNRLQQSQAGVPIRLQSNLVVLRVVVRDANGHAVDGLNKEDFRIFDNRKSQTISHFSLEAADAGKESGANRTAGAENESTETTARSDTPKQFTALFFDDFHLHFANLMHVQDAAKKYLAKKLGAGERVAIFEASGHDIVEFTSDRENLQRAISQVQFNSRSQRTMACPDLTPHHAQLIDDGLDRDALALGVQITIACLCNGDASHCSDVEAYTKYQAREAVMFNDVSTSNTLIALEALVQRMAGMPGDRRIVMISDGFLTQSQQFRLDAIVDQALRANVVINALDARGLYALTPGGDASARGMNFASDYLRTAYSNIQETGLQMDADAMNYAANGTGGIFVENTNDLEGGLEITASLRETSYILGFVPENLKADGQFHTLKVELVDKPHFTVQARRGYFAPRKTEDAAAAAKDEMRSAVFSQEKLVDLPLEIQTQFFKGDADTATVSVVIRTDVRGLRFRRENGRNLNELSVLAAVFDRDGNLVSSQEETAKLRLSDTSLEQVMTGGLPLTVKFNLKRGSYVVRTVVRDGNTQKLGATSQNMEIP